MNNILTCIKLDFYTIKKRQILFFVVFLLVLIAAGILLSPEVTIIAVFFSEFCATGCFQVGEKSGYNKLYGVLPVKRHEVVIGRYLFLLLIVAVTILIALIETRIASNFKTSERLDIIKTYNVSIPLLISLLFATTCFFGSIDFACSFSFEQSRAQFLTTIIIIAIAAATTPITKKITWENVSEKSSYSTGIFVTIGFALLIISCIISCFVYSKREL